MPTTLSPITAVIPSFTVTPQVNSATFPEDIDQYNTEMPSVISQQQALTTQINKLLPQLNSLENNVANLEASTISASSVALAAANFKGTWSSATSYTVASSVSLNGKLYMSLLPSTNQTPPNATYWYLITSIDDVTPSTLTSYSSSKTKGLIDALATEIVNIPSVASAINSAPSKTTPVNADKLGLWDSVSGALNNVSWSNLKATFKTYFDGIYANLVSPAFTGTPTAPSISYKATPVSITAWSYSGTTTTTITLTVASHTFVVNDFILVSGLTTSTAVSTANNYIIPNGVYRVTAITSTSISYQITTPSALTLTPTVSGATVNGMTAINGVVGGFGVGQTWKDMTANRAVATTYTNSTGNPIFVLLTFYNDINVYLDAITPFVANNEGLVSATSNISIVIPNGSTYKFASTNGITKWLELR